MQIFMLMSDDIRCKDALERSLASGNWFEGGECWNRITHELIWCYLGWRQQLMGHQSFDAKNFRLETPKPSDDDDDGAPVNYDIKWASWDAARWLIFMSSSVDGVWFCFSVSFSHWLKLHNASGWGKRLTSLVRLEKKLFFNFAWFIQQWSRMNESAESHWIVV